MANADISLLFGVLGEGSLSGESGSLIQSQLNQIMSALNKNPLKVKVALDTESGGQRSWNTQLQSKLNSISTSGKFSVQVSNIKIGAGAIADFKKQLNAVINTLNLDKGTSVTLTAEGLGKIVSDVKQVNAAAGNARSNMQALAAVIKEINLTNSKLSSAYASTKEKMISHEEIQRAEMLRAKFLELENASERLRLNRLSATEDDIQNVYRLQNELRELISIIQDEQAASESAASRNEKQDAERLATLKEVINAYNQLNNYIQKNPRIVNTTQGKQLASMRDELYGVIQASKSAENGLSTISRVDLRAVIDQMSQMQLELRNSGKEGKTLGGVIKSAYSKFGGWMLVTRSLMSVIRSIKQMVTNVREIDAAMTELKKVTSETEAVYNSFLSNAATRARALGATITDIVTATADFARLGYSIEDASTLADVATVYKNVGDGIEDISTASESIISTMKAFGIEAEDAMSIVDKFNEVGNNFAISSKGIGDALVRSAAALSAAGNSLDESIALITAANNVVQDPDKVGTTLKTVSMFLRAAKTEAEEAGESTDGMANSVSELHNELLALTGGKVDIQIDENTFKSTYQIIKELSDVWGELTDITQANILEMVGGKRNSNVVAALLTNFSSAEDVVKTSADSVGSALAENEKYLDSINGKLAQFQSAFESLSLAIVDSDFAKGVIDFGTGLIDILTAVIEHLGAIPTLLGAIGGALGAMGKSSIFSPFKISATGKNGFSLGITTQLAQDISAVGKYNQAIQEAINSGIDLSMNSDKLGEIITTTMASASASTKNFVVAQNGAKIATAGLSKTLIATKAASIAAAAGQAILNAAWSMGISLLITGIISGISKLITYQDDMAQKARDTAAEIKSSYKEATDEISDSINTLEGLDDEFTKLSRGVDAYGKNISLSTEEYERYKEIVSEVLGISPSLIEGYDAEGNAIANKNNLIERSIELLKEEQRLRLQEYVSDDSIVDLGRDAAQDIKDYKEEHPLPYDNAKWDFMNAFKDAANRYASETQGNYEGEIYDALNPGNLDLDDFFTAGYWSEYGDDANRFAQDYYEMIVDSLRNNRSLLSEYFTQDEIDNMLNIANSFDANVNSYNSRMSQYAKGLNSVLQVVPQIADGYDTLTDAQKGFVSSYINGIEISEEMSDEDFKNLKYDILDLVELIGENKNIGDDINALFSIDPSTTDFSEYETKVQQLIRSISRDTGIAEDDLTAKLGFDSVIDSYRVKLEYAKRLLADEYDDLAGALSLDELDVVYQITAQDGSMSFDDLQEKIDEVNTENATLNFDELRDSVSGTISEIQNVQKVLASQSAGQSISIADFNAEGMTDYQSALEYVNGAMQINADKARKIAEAKAKEQVAINQTNKALSQSKYLENAQQIEKYRQKLAKSNFENGETAESVRGSIDALLTENATLADTCKQYDLLSSAIQEAVDSYQHWLNAQNASDYGDMADDAVGAIERIRDTYDSESDIFGNFGSKKFDAAVDFIIPENIDQDDLGAIESYMDNFKQYLMFDDDGNADGLNVDTFLNNAVSAGLMSYSDDEGFQILGNKKMEDFAEGLNLSSGMVQAFFDELQLKGAEFDWGDETVKTFGDLAVEATEAAEALRLLEGNEDLSIKLDISDLETTEEQLSTLDDTIVEMNGIKAKPGVDSSEIEKANSVIRYCIAQKQLLTQPDVMRVDITQVEGDIADALLLLQQFQEAQDKLEILAAIGADTSEAEATVNELAEKIQNEQSTYIDCGLEIDTESVESIQSSISGLTAEMIVTAGVDASAITGYDPESKTCSVIYDPDTDLLPESFGPYDATVKYTPDTSDLPTRFKTLIRYVNHVSVGDVGIDGTAHVSGTARIGGDWGTARGGKTLVGELGQEIVVDPRTGKWYTVGDTGAEFVNIPAGAIVFNHKQTESLLANGYVSGRASALVNGTAMVTGGYKPYTPSTSNTTPNGNANANVTVTAEVDSSSLEEALTDTLDKLKEEIDDIIGNFEHSIFLLEKNKGSAEDIVAIYRKMQEAVHAQAEKYRALGLDENSDYIQELQKQWWEYQDGIQDVIVSEYERAVGERENAIMLTENWLNNAIADKNISGSAINANDIVAYYKQMQDIIHEQAEYYRSKGYSDTSDEVSKLSDLWWEYADSIKEVKQKVVDSLLEMVEAASSAVDEIQNANDVLHNAANEYASSGYISIDTLQEIIDLGPQYMQLLMDENGQLVINEERINAVIAARTQQLALENAMAYVARIRQATQNGSIESLNNLLYVTTDATNATWGLVYAELALMHQMGDLNDSQYNAALHNIQALQSLANSAISGIGQVAGSTSDTLNDMKSGLDDILKYVMDMLKQKINDQIDALEDMKDAYEDIIELRKEALNAAKEEADYQDEVAEKVKEIAKLQERINALSLDDSRDAQSQKAKLEEEMYELQNALADKQSDYAVNAQQDALDDMADAYADEKDEEIKILNDSISSYQKLYDMAIDYIGDHWDTLYGELIAWNTQYGNVLNSEITTAWDNCLAAARRYGSYVSALNNIDADISSANGDSHNDIVTDVNHNSNSADEDVVHAIIKEMYANSQAHHTADSGERERLNQRNLTLGSMLSQYGITAVRGKDGVWYINEVGGERLYDKYRKYIYHKGGVAGDEPTLKQNEVMAILEKGEPVLDKKKEQGLFRIIDFTTTLADKFGKLISSSGYNTVFGGSGDNTPKSGELVPITESQNASIQFGDVYIYGSNDETIEKHREINRQFANEVLKQLNIKR